MQRSPTFGAMVALGVAVALGLTAGASRTLAQPPPGGPPDGPPGGGPGGGPLRILLAPVVQKELKLTEDQKTRVYSLTQSAGRKGREMFQQAMAGGGGNPQAMMGAFQQLRQESDRAIGQILDKTQSERFEQIVLQSEGPLAVARPEIAAKVGVNRAQAEAIQTVMQQMQQSQRALFMNMRGQFGGGGGPFPGGPPDQGRGGPGPGGPGPGGMGPMGAMGQKIRAEGIAQISKILDRKQKAAFNKLLGEPFDLKGLETDRPGGPDGGPPPGPRDEEKGETRGTGPTSPENEAGPAPSRTAKRKTRSRTPAKTAASPE